MASEKDSIILHTCNNYPDQLDKERLIRLFESFDKNGDGRIDIHELRDAIERSRMPASLEHAQEVINIGDLNRDGSLDFTEFVRYVTEQEKRLWLIFDTFDHTRSGVIDVDDILITLNRIGIHATREEIDKIHKFMCKDGSVKVDWNLWRELYLLQPYADLSHLAHSWKLARVSDINEDLTVPDEYAEAVMGPDLWWRILAAGAGAGAVSRTITAPLDRLKVYLQVHASGQNKLGLKSSFEAMIKEGGLRSMWRGNGVNVLKIAPESAIKFLAYEQAKRLLNPKDPTQLSIKQRLVAGSLAGFISQTSIYPMEVLKTRLALATTGMYRGIWHAARIIGAKEGISAFYRGLMPSLLGIIPYAGIDLGVYETLKVTYLRYRDMDQSADPGVFVLLTCGTISSSCGQIASYPLALVRTKLQAQAQTMPHEPSPGMITIFRKIIEEDGPRGLYRGILPNFMKVVPAVSITYVIYERIKRTLGVYRPPKQ
ncbi:uncharacterized protein TRIADDRAFT_21490 [Trichoplax adhaerens]|uniref:EF-hand domain-containing protein n=1 Tax=Trichoplax adhaerens TaxID=10228 RepID=B3RPE8_TRIAD|nr:hypothetical protein TRIADDRAFT_21490 [Trichoplax adhaerens]EDV28178.1 hypothetical protein TRIADDRAFT_21490 [Trichoplax adhaerens]|eukprot:XP_002110012.1 hypothetical protein TRIADDRAFT_21490 [Trichoplax adhaerens]